MSLKLAGLIKKTEAALQTETDPKKLRALASSLAMYSATRADMGDDDDGDDDEGKKKKGDDDDGDDESKAKKAAESARKMKAKAESAKHRAKAAEHKQKAAESEELAKKAEEESSEESEEEASTETPAPVAQLTPGAAAAIASQGEIGREALSRIGKLEKAAEARELSALINDARAARRITPAEAKTLAKKPSSFVRDFLEMRPNALVNIDEDSMAVPDGTPAADIPANVKAIVEQMIEAQGLTGDKAKAAREVAYEDQRRAAAQTGGVH